MCFEVYTKPNFQQKYLNVESTHTDACNKAITHGVGIRIASLTTRTKENENKSLSKLCPQVDESLKTAGLLKQDQQLPTLGKKILDSREREIVEAQLARAERKKDRRNVYLLTKYSGQWRTPIHKTIKRLKKKHGGQWSTNATTTSMRCCLEISKPSSCALLLMAATP